MKTELKNEAHSKGKGPGWVLLPPRVPEAQGSVYTSIEGSLECQMISGLEGGSVVGRLEVCNRVPVQFKHPKGNTGTRISSYSSLRTVRGFW